MYCWLVTRCEFSHAQVPLIALCRAGHNICSHTAISIIQDLSGSDTDEFFSAMHKGKGKTKKKRKRTVTVTQHFFWTDFEMIHQKVHQGKFLNKREGLKPTGQLSGSVIKFFYKDYNSRVLGAMKLE